MSFFIYGESKIEFQELLSNYQVTYLGFIKFKGNLTKKWFFFQGFILPKIANSGIYIITKKHEIDWSIKGIEEKLKQIDVANSGILCG